MIIDAIRMNQGYVDQCSIIDNEPNTNITNSFFLSFKNSNEPLWNERTNHNKLLVIASTFTTNLDYGLSKTDYDRIIKFVRNI